VGLDIRRVGVVGAGAMGRRIAQVSAAAGCDVHLFDMATDAVARARDMVREDLAQGAAKGRLTQDDADATLARIVPAADLAQLQVCDLVVEARSVPAVRASRPRPSTSSTRVAAAMRFARCASAWDRASR